MQAIYNIAEICAQKGIKNIVLSPGSRCAPLTIAFARHPNFRPYTISDERSAAFIALGMALQTKTPSVLVCTSGTATLNYAPAIAEAFFQQVPLLILTADRPQEWIAQQDGQTIYQQNIYGKHVKGSYQLPSDFSHPDANWFVERTLSEATNKAQAYPPGPVHINIPLREPLYPSGTIKFDQNVKVITELSGSPSIAEEDRNRILKQISTYSKIMVVAGQNTTDTALTEVLTEFSNNYNIPIVADIIANQKHPDFINGHDLFINNINPAQYQPEVLITFGMSLISKGMKLFLRKNKPTIHIHLDPQGIAADPFQSLTMVVRETPVHFLREAINAGLLYHNEAFGNLWKQASNKGVEKLNHFLNSNKEWSEISAVNQVIAHLPANSSLHLANSMPVRYAGFVFAGQEMKGVECFANRGTSGIDGVISTAYGMALLSSKTITVITGDLSFFYDRNALWNNYLPGNLKIILLNNHGGNIFRIIDGPNQQPELEEYFETHQPLNARRTAEDAGFNYIKVNNSVQLKEGLKQIYSNNKPYILEAEFDGKVSHQVFCDFKETLKSM
ncbi:2-succinyl-5-enolpyruvyl-6-hydroxy-3-cyclohexene-1-carboxylic-acid synthase [Cytophagaceae bacterium ABcell3]|nr:2-succinyl-5-enolpyruvyl-6-hydroxy-3-cyclohexene-1-carboxylic-acid synthase [Cytophagaceae bacterium ABcell3]